MKKQIAAILTAALMTAAVPAGAVRLLDLSESDEWYYKGVFYGRGLQLQTEEAGENKGKLYATSEYYYYPNQRYGHEHFPIFESSDGGKTFSQISSLYESEYNKKKYIKDENGNYIEAYEGAEGAERMCGEYWGFIYQPTLFELPEKVGSLEKGTVLCAGLAKSTNYSAIEIYYSTDGLKNWEYLSTVSMGGKAEMNKASAIWEPYLVCENGALYCFYSDERGMTGGGQRLVYKKSTDGVSWGDDVKVCDFEAENDKYRPGMPVVAKLKNGKFMLIYEGVNMGTHVLPIYYKVSDNIEVWDSADHGVLMPHPVDSGSPFCAAMPDGTIIAGASGTSKIAVNTDNLTTNRWVMTDTDIIRAYSRSLFPLTDGSILVTSGGNHGDKTPHSLDCSVERLPVLSKIHVDEENVSGSEPWGETKPNWGNSYTKVIDGNGQTFYDANKDSELVIDLGSDYAIDAIGFEPRYHFIERMAGGTFYASEDKESWNEIYKITKNPAEGSVTYVEKKDLKNVNGRYRYIKYTTNGAVHCSVAEIEIYSKEAMTISVNGKVLPYGKKAIVKDEVLLPMRLVCEELGGKVSWNGDKKEATAEFENGTYSFVCGETAELIDSVTYVPMSVISEKLGYGCVYDEDANRVYITAE